MNRKTVDFPGFVHAVRLKRDDVPDFAEYPFSIPAVRGLDTLDLDPKITFLIGENGAGKSTLIEAIAVAAGFNAEGGTRNFRFATRRSESDLHHHLRLVRTARRLDGFFLRAESLFNVATQIDNLDELALYRIDQQPQPAVHVRLSDSVPAGDNGQLP